MQAIALEGYYIFDNDALAFESMANIGQMIIGFIIKVAKAFLNVLSTKWPLLLSILASIVLKVAMNRATGVCADELVNKISSKFTSIGNHVAGVIADLATGVKDITVAQLHMKKVVEDNNEMNALNDELVKPGGKYYPSSIKTPYVTKEAYDKCREAYNHTKDTLEEAIERLEVARKFDYESRGAAQNAANEVRAYFTGIQQAFQKLLANITTVLSNVTQTLSRRKK